MRNLTAFLVKNFHWLLFVILEVISAVLLFRYNNYQNSVWVSSANMVTGKVYDYSSQIDSYFHLNQLNENLTRRNLYLEQKVAHMQEQLDTLNRDTLLQHMAQTQLQGYKLISAQVTSNSLDKKDNLITINKGAADGVKKNMGVASGNGIVGVVFLVGQHHSVVLPVLNSHSNISCMISNRGYFGYLHWEGGYRHMAYVDGIPRHAHFRPGDYVVTSGYSSIFPQGLMVGQIKYVFNSPDGQTYRLKIKLATDFGNLRDVCVIDNSGLQEQIDLLRAANDSLKNKQE